MFTITENPPSITCGFCKRTSYNTGDVANRYCGNCHLFHDVVAQARILYLEGATHDCGEWRTATGICAICERNLDA